MPALLRNTPRKILAMACLTPVLTLLLCRSPDVGAAPAPPPEAMPPAEPRSPTTAQLIEQSAHLHTTMRQQAAQLRAQQEKLSALSRRVLQHRSSPARSSCAPAGGSPSGSPRPASSPPFTAHARRTEPHAPTPPCGAAVPELHPASRAGTHPPVSTAAASFSVHRSSRCLSGGLGAWTACGAPQASGPCSGPQPGGCTGGLTDTTAVRPEVPLPRTSSSSVHDDPTAAARPWSSAHLSHRDAPFQVRAASSTRQEPADAARVPWGRAHLGAHPGQSQKAADPWDMAAAGVRDPAAARMPDGDGGHMEGEAVAAAPRGHGAEGSDVRSAVRDLLEAVAETRRRRSAFQDAHGCNAEAHGHPAGRMEGTGIAQHGKSGGEGHVQAGAAFAGGSVEQVGRGPVTDAGDGGLAAVQHPVVQSVLSQIVSSIATSSAAAGNPAAAARGTVGVAASAQRGEEAGADGQHAMNGTRGSWQERRGGGVAERPQPPPVRGTSAMPRTANGWRGFLSVKDLQPQAARPHRQDGGGGRSGDGGRAGAAKRRPEWNGDVMPAAAVAGRGKRGVAPMAGWRSEHGMLPPAGALQSVGTGRGRHGAQVALGKRNRDGVSQRRGGGGRGRGGDGGAGRRGRPRQPQMDAEAWRAMTEGADDPLLEGEETGLSLGLRPEEELEAAVETDLDQRQMAVAALEAELAEAALREAGDGAFSLLHHEWLPRVRHSS